MTYRRICYQERRMLRSAFLLFLFSILFFTLPHRAEATVLIKVGSDVTVEEEMTIDDVITVGGQITVQGRVANHVVAVGGSVVLANTAIVGGNVISLGGIIVRARGAEVNGNMTEINSAEIANLIESALRGDWQGWSWIYAVLSIFIFTGFLMLALLIVAFVPKHINTISTAIQENTLNVILLGLAGFLMIVPLAVLLTISVVGIVLIPLEMILVTCAVLVGFTAVSQLVGKRIFILIKSPHHGIIGETLWGLLILWIIGWLPYIGIMIKIFAVILALGGVMASRFGTKTKFIQENKIPIND
jgi:hypothetical protein